MQTVRKFLITTVNNPDGITYTYDTTTGEFVGVYINEKAMPIDKREKVISQLLIRLDLFLQWASHHAQKSGFEVVELETQITFDMFWNSYNDKLRSSKKRSEKLWQKLDEANQVKAFYFIKTYNRNRGNAEKKYCETYLSAELWNN